MLLGYDPPPNNDNQQLPPAPLSPTDCATPTKAGVYCEIVIPSLHTKERPTLAKSKSDSSVSNINQSESSINSSVMGGPVISASLVFG